MLVEVIEIQSDQKILHVKNIYLGVKSHIGWLYACATEARKWRGTEDFGPRAKRVERALRTRPKSFHPLPFLASSHAG